MSIRVINVILLGTTSKNKTHLSNPSQLGCTKCVQVESEIVSDQAEKVPTCAIRARKEHTGNFFNNRYTKF